MRVIRRMLFGVLIGVVVLGTSGARAQNTNTITLDLGDGVKLECVFILPGTFMMGSTEGTPHLQDPMGPVHKVTITKPFYMGKYEVTIAQYNKVMGGDFKGEKEELQHPVQGVAWKAAQEYCKKVGESNGKTVRLPTEAEWEFACRAGTTTRWCCGDDESKIPEYGWFWQSWVKPVGQLKPNAWGLYDMHGNIWEWVQDLYEPYTSEPQVDPKGAATGEHHVIRGGTRHGIAMEGQSSCRVHEVNWGNLEDGRGVGLRVVVEANQTPHGVSSPTTGKTSHEVP
jgi:formylglycine-generating enzyme required for sulfatase activity